MLDISDHGGNFGNGLVKGKKISVYSLSPKFITVSKGNSSVNTYSTTALNLIMDEVQNLLFLTGTNGGEQRYVRVYQLDNMKVLKDFFPSEYGTSSNPRLFNAFAYDAQADAVYTSWSSSGSSSIKKISCKSPFNTISTVSSIACVTSVLKQDSNEIIFWSNSTSSPGIYSLNRSNDAVTLLLSTAGETPFLISGFNKIVLMSNTAVNSMYKHRIFDMKLNLVSTITPPALLATGPKMYHSITNTVKVLTYEYGNNGGQFFYTYDASTFQFLYRERLSTIPSFSVPTPLNSYYNDVLKEWFCDVGDPNYNNNIAIFRINDDGTVKDLNKASTAGWFDSSFFPSYPSYSGISSVFGENKVCFLGATNINGSNYRDILLAKPFVTWEG